jgi:hypothetical protein
VLPDPIPEDQGGIRETGRDLRETEKTISIAAMPDADAALFTGYHNETLKTMRSFPLSETASD